MYKDPSRSIAERVSDLIDRMTLEEKVAQLCGCWPFELLGREGLDSERMKSRLVHGLGQVSRLAGMSAEPPSKTADIVNAIQRYLSRKHAPGYPGHSARGMPLRVSGPPRHGLPAGDWLGSDLGP